MNSAVELHDSWITKITPSRGSITVRLRAYILRSHDRPGLDSGSVWTQDVVLEVADFTLDASFSEVPQQLSGGWLQFDGMALQNFLPLPLEVHGKVRFLARSVSGEQLVIKGSRATLVGLGEACFVEYFAACLEPDGVATASHDPWAGK